MFDLRFILTVLALRFTFIVFLAFTDIFTGILADRLSIKLGPYSPIEASISAVKLMAIESVKDGPYSLILASIAFSKLACTLSVKLGPASAMLALNPVAT